VEAGTRPVAPAPPLESLVDSQPIDAGRSSADVLAHSAD
jgi:hypothetical protein